MAKWDDAKASALKILGDKGKVPDMPDIVQKAADDLKKSSDEFDKCREDCEAKLLALQDPDDGAPIVRAVYKRDDSSSGPYLQNAAALQVGMHDGYRVSWQTTLGGSPPGIVYKNDRKWSADHGGYDFAITSGVFVTGRRINTESPRIIDIAPTVLRYFGLSVPADIDGKPLF